MRLGIVVRIMFLGLSTIIKGVSVYKQLFVFLGILENLKKKKNINKISNFPESQKNNAQFIL
jgi:hypothetical protein